MTGPVIIFLTDYGLTDPFVGICHGVIAMRCPQARVIDLSHGIPPQDVRAGATVLARAVPFLPPGVLLAVVDPGVGGARRGVALRAASGALLVGPDNGLLLAAATVAGGVIEAVDLAGSRFALQPVSATFHGRDVFAPVAAALAGGARLGEVGAAIDPSCLVALEPLRAVVEPGMLRARVAAVDRFGNLELAATPEDLLAAGLVGRPDVLVQSPAGPVAARRGRVFSEVAPGGLILLTDSSGAVAIAVCGGSAAERLQAGSGDELRIRPA